MSTIMDYTDLKNNPKQLCLSESCDNTVTLSVMPKKDFDKEKLMAYFGLTSDLKYDKNARTRSDNWGRWSEYKVNGHTQYSVRAGCHHEHDCCGCICAVYIEVAEMHSNWIVTVDCTRNL